MSDLPIFVMGCLVTLVVSGAVGLLLWGAGNEPGGESTPSRTATDAKPQTSSVRTEEQQAASRLAS